MLITYNIKNYYNININIIFILNWIGLSYIKFVHIKVNTHSNTATVINNFKLVVWWYRGNLNTYCNQFVYAIVLQYTDNVTLVLVICILSFVFTFHTSSCLEIFKRWRCALILSHTIWHTPCVLFHMQHIVLHTDATGLIESSLFLIPLYPCNSLCDLATVLWLSLIHI